jgi:hypothetical protein
VLINKRRNDSQALHLVLPAPANGTGWEQVATVSRLVALGPDPLLAKEGVTLGGVTFDYAGGAQSGTPTWDEIESCEWGGTNSTKRAWGIDMPPASAAMVTIRRVG